MLIFWTKSLKEKHQNKTFFVSNCKLYQGTKGPDSHKTRTQGSHISPWPRPTEWNPPVWMLLAHQGERTVTGLARQLINHHLMEIQCVTWTQALQGEKFPNCHVNLEINTQTCVLAKKKPIYWYLFRNKMLTCKCALKSQTRKQKAGRTSRAN